MSEESHVTPLAPPQIYRRSDEEWGAITKPKDTRHRHRRSSKCFVYLLLFFVLLSIAALVFGLVVLRINAPKLKLEVVQIKNLKYTAPDFASLNMTLVAQVKIYNQNFGGFTFQNGSTSMVYGNTTLGMTYYKSGLVRGRKAVRMNVTVQVKASNGLAENKNFSSDMGSGLVKLSSYANLRGEIRVLKHLTRRRTSFMNCTMSLNLTSHTVQDLRCM